MFVGEFSCLGAYFAVKFYNHRKRRSSDDLGPIDESPISTIESAGTNPSFNYFIFLPASACDMVATSLMYVGLNMTNAASFQMLRGAYSDSFLLIHIYLHIHIHILSSIYIFMLALIRIYIQI